MSEISAKYERLIGDLRQDFRPQREWGEGRGIFIVVGHFLVGVAAGAWLFGLAFSYPPGLALGFLLAGAGGIAHLAFLGRPERFWRMARHARTSWIARGFVGLALFLVGAALYLPPLLVAAWPWGAASLLAQAGWPLAAAGMLVLIGYMGFVYTASKGIPFWSSPLHPILYVAYALRGGAAAMLVAMALLGAPDGVAAGRVLDIWIALTALVTLLFGLDIYAALAGGNAASRRSVHELLAGRLAGAFYLGTLLIGLIVPAVLAGARSAAVGLGVMAAIGLCSTVGDFFMKYTSIRAGVYLPLLPRRTTTRWR
ncbi:MAG TPA: NrfD/PsrC family molybdoenzyme membrane anchor subunit [Xanthobacteraceae bacterium]|jgi:formate-dependent nitrite reductase membrane component NrfD